MLTIEDRVKALPNVDRMEAVKTIGLFLAELEKGTIRAASRDDMGVWHAQAWVKEGILATFRSGIAAEFASGALSFIDKDTLPARRFKAADGIRIVPGGSSVRRGAFIARGVVMMPPAYVNIGAYVDEETMIDSHALVGSCAQIGKRVHLSAAAQIGGVLEPIGNVPVVIEDDVVVGGNCGIYEGTIVRSPRGHRRRRHPHRLDAGLRHRARPDLPPHRRPPPRNPLRRRRHPRRPPDERRLRRTTRTASRDADDREVSRREDGLGDGARGCVAMNDSFAAVGCRLSVVGSQ